jgi:hypothetical protein
MKTPLAALWILVLVAQTSLWWRAIAWYPSIPDRYPSRFDIDGNPVSWATKSLGSWFLLPAIGTVLVIGLLIFAGWALPRIARTAPGRLNLPLKQRFLALDPDRRVWAVSPVLYFLALVALYTSALWIWVLETLARGSTELKGPTLLWPGVYVALVLASVTILAWTLHRRLWSTTLTCDRRIERLNGCP